MIDLADVRVDVGGVPEVDGLSVQSASNRIALLGGGRGLFEALAGMRPTARGKVVIGGSDPRTALREGTLAAAPLDPAVPPKWTAGAYAAWSARLAGRPSNAAEKDANDVLRALGVDPTTVLGKAPRELVRGTLIGAAIATGAKTIVLADPSEGIDARLARQLGKATCAALEGRNWILFANALPLASPFALEVEEAFVLRDARIVARGAPAEIAALERSYIVRVLGDVAAFAKAVEVAGGRVHEDSAGESRETMSVDLGAELQVRDLFALAEDSNASLVEVLPLGRAFP